MKYNPLNQSSTNRGRLQPLLLVHCTEASDLKLPGRAVAPHSGTRFRPARRDPRLRITWMMCHYHGGSLPGTLGFYHQLCIIFIRCLVDICKINTCCVRKKGLGFLLHGAVTSPTGLEGITKTMFFEELPHPGGALADVTLFSKNIGIGMSQNLAWNSDGQGGQVLQIRKIVFVSLWAQSPAVSGDPTAFWVPARGKYVLSSPIAEH